MVLPDPATAPAVRPFGARAAPRASTPPPPAPPPPRPPPPDKKGKRRERGGGDGRSRRLLGERCRRASAAGGAMGRTPHGPGPAPEASAPRRAAHWVRRFSQTSYRQNLCSCQSPT